VAGVKPEDFYSVGATARASTPAHDAAVRSPFLEYVVSAVGKLDSVFYRSRCPENIPCDGRIVTTASPESEAVTIGSVSLVICLASLITGGLEPADRVAGTGRNSAGVRPDQRPMWPECLNR
jgi:hypothetical protein